MPTLDPQARRAPVIIATADHPHNGDPCAALCWHDRETSDSVYSVRAGYVATIGRVGAYDTTFPSLAAAYQAIHAFRGRVQVDPMFPPVGALNG